MNMVATEKIYEEINSKGDLLKKWSEEKQNVFGIDCLSLTVGPFSFEVNIENHDKECAWNLYVELLTRVTTQKLDDNYGDEKAALNSVYEIFKETRTILRENGREAKIFTEIAIIVLNLCIRPFNTKWHRGDDENIFETEEKKLEFREDLRKLQAMLVLYAKILADIAGVDDLTEMLDAEPSRYIERNI